MKMRLAILVCLVLPLMGTPSHAACKCQCVAGTMTAICANSMMDMPITCTPTPCRTNQPASGQQPQTAPQPKGRCREERVCDSYGTCRMDRICN